MLLKGPSFISWENTRICDLNNFISIKGLFESHRTRSPVLISELLLRTRFEVNYSLQVVFSPKFYFYVEYNAVVCLIVFVFDVLDNLGT